MSKKFDIDTDGNFKKFLGKQHRDEVVKDVEEPGSTETPQVISQNPLVEKKDKPVRSSPKPVGQIRIRTKGRPKVKRELKKRYTFTVFPSVYEPAFEKAEEEGLSLSEVVSLLLEAYIREA